MNVTLRQLKVFATVARQLSFTRAARELHLTQPAVSMQVKQLEETLGLPLFDHVGKKIYLTEAGREMDRYAHRVDAALQEAQQVIDGLKGLQRGELKISVASTVSQFATKTLAAFVQKHPGIRVKLDVSNRQTVLRQLATNLCDLVLMGQPPDDRNLESIVFLPNPLVIIAPTNHPLVGEKGIPLARLADETFLIREPGSGTRMAFERLLTQHDVVLGETMEMNNNEAIKQSVSAGLGLGMVSLHTISDEVAHDLLKVIEVQEFPIQRFWYLVHNRGKRLSPSALAFKDLVLESEQ